MQSFLFDIETTDGRHRDVDVYDLAGRRDDENGTVFRQRQSDADRAAAHSTAHRSRSQLSSKLSPVL